MNQQERVQREKGKDRQSWLTSTEFCAYLGINPRRFRRWRDSGRIPEPAARTSSGYGLWSPTQQQEVAQKELT